jgi:hypothetical protein
MKPQDPSGGTPLWLEKAITRYARVPLSADDPEMENGWQCVAVPPTNDPRWFVIDESRDYKTVWGRFRPDAEGGP